MRCFNSVTKRSKKRKTRSDSVTAKIMKSGDVISSHEVVARGPIIWWIIGMHIATRIGSSQLRQIALLTPRFVDDKSETWPRGFCCFLIELDGEIFWSVVASVGVWELSDEGVVVVVLVLIDVFFNDDFREALDCLADACRADVSISNSDWIIKTIATRVDELNKSIAAKLELNNPYHSWKWQNKQNSKCDKRTCECLCWRDVLN